MGGSGSGGVRGSELDAVLECVREMDGIDMDGDDRGEPENGTSASKGTGEVVRDTAAVVELNSNWENRRGRCRDGDISIPTIFVPASGLSALLGIEIRDCERTCI